jgi:uncharacterized membrane protein YcaP (DUF421 family)
MLSKIYSLLDHVLGLSIESHDLTFAHMTARGFVVFAFAVILVRLADRRFLGRNAGFDAMLLVILGSVLSRGVNGQAAFFPTLGVSAVLVFLHHLLATAAFHSHAFSRLVKGNCRVLVQKGQVDPGALKKFRITHDDLLENLRLNGNVAGTEAVKAATLERNGEVSVIK